MSRVQERNDFRIDVKKQCNKMSKIAESRSSGRSIARLTAFLWRVCLDMRWVCGFILGVEAAEVWGLSIELS